MEPPAPLNLDFVPQRLQRLRQLLQTEFESRLNRAERRARDGCDLAMTHAGKERELKRFTLMFWQDIEASMQEGAQIRARDMIVRCVVLGRCGLFV